MFVSWPKFWGSCKSRLAAIGRECFLTRQKWRERARRWRRTARRLERRVGSLQSINERLKQDLSKLKSKLAEQKPIGSTVAGRTKTDSTTDSTKPKGCQYSASEISLAINLARKVGFRPTVKVLQVFYKWLGSDNSVPTYQAIRSWTQRVGLDRTEHAKKINGAPWILDHTCQIGKEKVLTVMRVRPSNSLNKQQPLKLCDLELLAEVCRSTWTDNDVHDVLQATSQKYGAPGALLADQARNLQKPASAFQNADKNVHILVDFKHFLANQFKLMLQADTDYPEFTKQLQHTCACVQQTELSHFVPRPMKRKARFMNLGPVLRWANAMLWHLDHPESQSRRNISQERMEEKFGWLRDLKNAISRWQHCQDVIDIGVKLVNHKGLSRTTADEFNRLAEPSVRGKNSRKLLKQATLFLNSQAEQLDQGEIVPLSTEVIESVFASFKTLEKQHSKEGFSSLILAISTLLRPVTDKEVIRSFSRTKCQDVSTWVETNLGRTYTSKRQDVFRECRQTNSQSATAIAA